MTEHTIIHAHVTNPAEGMFKQGRNDRAECTVVSCSASERCGLYSSGQCCRVGSWLTAKRCPYGKATTLSEHTRRARKYSAWIAEKKKQYADVLNKLNHHVRKIARIGDFVFLPYAHMDMNESLPFTAHGGAFRTGQPFLPVAAFTLQTVLEIVNFRPQAMMGGEITSYQKEIVPRFLIHLSEEFPEMYAAVIKERPELDTNRSNIGRRAYVITLKEGAVIPERQGTFTWDGVYLTSTDLDILFSAVKYDTIKVRMMPKENECVTITSEDQVCATTRYKD